MRQTVDEAFKFDTKILVEKALNVIELEVAVLESLEDQWRGSYCECGG